MVEQLDIEGLQVVQLHLTPDVENRLRKKAAEQGKSFEDFLGWLADVWAEQGTYPQLAVDEWISQWEAWVKKPRPAAPGIDDSREAIYQGRE